MIAAELLHQVELQQLHVVEQPHQAELLQAFELQQLVGVARLMRGPAAGRAVAAGAAPGRRAGVELQAGGHGPELLRAFKALPLRLVDAGCVELQAAAIAAESKAWELQQQTQVEPPRSIAAELLQAFEQLPPVRLVRLQVRAAGRAAAAGAAQVRRRWRRAAGSGGRG